MTELFESITTVITSVMTLFGKVSTSLMGNEIFQLMFGIVVLGVIMGIVFTLVRKVKRRGR